jgi:glycosyltransferase involved in cell wall biosynthesis
MNAPLRVIPSATKPIRVAVYLADQNPHRDRSLGITSMTRSLLDSLSPRKEIEVSLVASRSSFGASGRSERLHRIPFRTDRAIGRLICDTMHPLVVRPDADLWYYPKGYLSLVMRPSIPVVGTMHDAIIQHYADHYPETRSRRAFGYWLQVMKRSLRRLDLVMTVSEHSKRQLEEFCDRYKIQAPPIEVTYEGSSWENYRDRTWAKGNEVVHLASGHQHKRTNHLLRMWQELQQQKIDLPPMRLVGRLDEEGVRLLEGLKFVEISAPLDDAALVETVGKARALIVPSEIEGFGLPALEAYYVGTPVCYVSGTSVAEVVTDQGRFGAFELADSKSLLTALRASLSASSTSVRDISDTLYDLFSNERCADRVIASFATLLGLSKPAAAS